jgi:ligand-binding sensor domain-containing protein
MSHSKRRGRVLFFPLNIGWYQQITEHRPLFTSDSKRGLHKRNRVIDMPSKKYHSQCTIALALLIIISTASPVFALDPKKTINQYGHNIWVKQNGLPAHAINVALQTQDGYLWLGTSAGLFRFDGAQYTEVITNPKNSRTHESISELFESRDSTLWIGTRYNGLRKIKNGEVSLYGLTEGFFDTQVRELFETKTGHLLIATSIGVFMFYDGKFSQILFHPNYITAITDDSLGRIWVGTHEGVRIFEEAHPTKIISLTVKDGIPNNVTTSIYLDRQANVWIGTADGLARWKNNKITKYTYVDGLLDNYVNTIFEDRNGNIWIGTQKGLNRFCEGKWTSYTKSDGLTDNNVTSIEEDSEGSLWVCTSDGLNQFRDVNITTYTTSEGLANDYISTVIEKPDGSLYFLSDKGANITQFKNNKITRYDYPVGPAYIARDGSLWIGQTGVLLNIKNDQIKRYDTTSGLPSKWISAISEDNKSLIFYSDHSGIYRFIQGRVAPYTLTGGQQHPPTEYIVCFYPQRNNLMWVGTADWLSKIEDGKITSYTTADGLAGNWVSSIYDDRQGNLWISSPQGGLTRYRDGKFTIYNTKIGLFSDEIYCVLGDNQGELWLSSPRGIGRMSLQDFDDYDAGRSDTLHSQVYVTADGMKTDECFGEWQPAGWKAKDGHLWFATKRGAVMIDPKALQRNTRTPHVLIEKVVIDQQTIMSNQLERLSPGKESFEFHYTALSFLVPERVLFKYKLEGYDREWVDAGTRRVAYYTNLPSGDYRFRVIACNNDGLWSQTGASVAFELAPHFYQALWFYGLVLCTIGGAGFGAYRMRVWQLLKREEELKHRIDKAITRIKILDGLIPICANCKKIRDDKGYWNQLEQYINEHSEATFSHGICPECKEKLYGDYFAKLKKQKEEKSPPSPFQEDSPKE